MINGELMKYRIFFSIFFVIFIQLANASLVSKKIKRIKESDNIILGEGTANFTKQADDLALKDLVSQISTNVQTSFEDMISEKNGKVEEYTKSVVNTYSNTTLNRASRLVDEETFAPQIYVIRYIEKEKMEEIFEDRKNKIVTLVSEGLLAEKEYRVADALRNFYWAFRLLRSHPDNKKILYNFPERGNLVLYTALENRILRIFSIINFEISKTEENSEEDFTEYFLSVSFNKENAANLTFAYNDGYEYSKPINIRNGLAVIEFHGEAADVLKEIKLRVEYEFYSHITDKEIKQVFDDIEPYYFKESNIKIPLQKTNIKSKTPEKEKVTAENFNDELTTEDTEICLSVIEEIIEAIRTRKFDSVKKHFTPNGWDTFTKTVKYGNATLVAHEINIRFGKLRNLIIAREIPMKFSFEKNEEVFSEDVVLTFLDGKVEAVSFSLSQIAVDDLLKKSNDFATFEEKMQIIQFMETYKTAYCLERIDYLNSVFASDALIIVGQVLQKAPEIDIEGMLKKIKNEDVKYFKQTKTEYMDHLKKVFGSNEVVNLRFEDNEVRRAQNKKVFGIQISQYYYSTNYADKGYLFLMFDLTDINNPKILVRSWQPQKSSDGSIMGITDFEF